MSKGFTPRDDEPADEAANIGGGGDPTGVFVTVNRNVQSGMHDRELFNDDEEDEEEEEYDAAASSERIPPGYRPFDRLVQEAPSVPKTTGHPVGCRCQECSHPHGCRCAACHQPQRQAGQDVRRSAHARRTQRVMAQVDMRHAEVSRQRQHFQRRTAVINRTKHVALGLAVIAIAAYFYQFHWTGVELLPQYQFHVRFPGHTLTPSLELTPDEIWTGLMMDVPISRVLKDMQTHLRLNLALNCICMHHLGGFKAASTGKVFPPRRVCAVINRPFGEVDFMANPSIIGASKATGRYSERSLACHPSDTNAAAAVDRPLDIWVEWTGLVPGTERQLPTYTRKLSGPQAACMALAIEELDGKTSCKTGARMPVPPASPADESPSNEKPL